METYMTTPKDIQRQWHLVDLKDKVLGREATKMATLLIGKNKVYYVLYLDCGDYIVVLNAAKVRLTGKKEQQKQYFRHSGYPSGLKIISYREQKLKDPTKIVKLAVSRMLPKNKLRSQRLARLKIFKDESHPYGEKFADK